MTDQTLTTGRSLSEFTAQLASAQSLGGHSSNPSRKLPPARVIPYI